MSTASQSRASSGNGGTDGVQGLTRNPRSSPSAEPAARSRVLAADDQQDILDALTMLLRPAGYDVDVVRSPALVREALGERSYDALLIDLNYTRDTTSGREGLD